MDAEAYVSVSLGQEDEWRGQLKLRRFYNIHRQQVIEFQSHERTGFWYGTVKDQAHLEDPCDHKFNRCLTVDILCEVYLAYFRRARAFSGTRQDIVCTGQIWILIPSSFFVFWSFGKQLLNSEHSIYDAHRQRNIFRGL